MVDEIPNFHPSVPPPTSKPLLVFPDTEDFIPVSFHPPPCVLAELRGNYSTLLTGNPDDDRSDDEGDGEEDTQKKK